MLLKPILLLLQGVSALLAPRARVQAHYEGIRNNSAPNTYLVFLHAFHTITEHFSNINLNVSEHAASFFLLKTSNAYCATILNATIIHELIRWDPGVQSVRHDAIYRMQTPELHWRRDAKASYGRDHSPKVLKRDFVAEDRPDRWWWRMITTFAKLPIPIPIEGPYDRRAQVMARAGVGVNVYVFDSGVNPHQQFEGRIHNMNGRAYEEETPYCPGENFFDSTGHGTSVAGLIAGKTIGVASGANIINVKLFCNDHILAMARWIQAIDDVIAEHNLAKTQSDNYRGAIIHMSFAAYYDQSNPPVDLNNAHQRAFDAGIPIMVSGGNVNEDARKQIPRAFPSTFVVGMVDNSYAWSNEGYGPRLGIFAPGENIESCTPGNNAMDAVDAKFSGTSMAVPFVTGFAAMVLSYEGPRGTISGTQKVYDQIALNSLPNVITGLPADTVNLLFQTGIGHPRRQQTDPYFV